MKTALRKLETLVSEHEYRLKCFVWDILDLHENNWEQLRSLNWIHQFTPSDFLTAKEEDELEPILRLLDTNYKVTNTVISIPTIYHVSRFTFIQHSFVHLGGYPSFAITVWYEGAEYG